MRKYILILPLLLSFAFASCQKDEISGESIFKETESRYTEFDDWLHRHYVEPYNIRFEYRMPDRETSFGYWERQLLLRRLRPLQGLSLKKRSILQRGRGNQPRVPHFSQTQRK